MASIEHSRTFLGIGLGEAARSAFCEAVGAANALLAADAPSALLLLGSAHPSGVVLEGGAPAKTVATLNGAARGVPVVFLHPGREAPSGDFRTLSLDAPHATLTAHLRSFFRPRLGGRRELAGHGWRLEFKADADSHSFPLDDLSTTGVSILVDGDTRAARLLHGNELRGLRIVDASGAVALQAPSGRVRHVRRAGNSGAVHVGISFESPPPRSSPYDQLVDGRDEVMSAIDRAIANGCSFVAGIPDGDDSWRLGKAVVVDGKLHFAPPPPVGIVPLDVVRLTFDYHGRSFTGLGAVAGVTQGLVVAPPRKLRAYHRRASHRLKLEESRGYRVHLVSKIAGIDASFPVDDLNAGGIGAVSDADAHVFPVGLVFDSVELTGPALAAPLVGTGVLRARIRLPSEPGEIGRPMRVGIELVGLDLAARRAMNGALATEGYPTIEAAIPADFEEIWRLLRRARFDFRLYKHHDEAGKRLVASAFEHQTSSDSQGVAVQLICRRDNDLRGLISGLRLYSRTWLGTHLAAIQSRSPLLEDRISRLLTLALNESFENEPTADFARVMWKSEQSQLEDLHGRSGAAHRAGLSEFRDFGVVVKKLASVPPSGDLPRVREASEGDLAAVSTELSRLVSPLRMSSDDFSPELLRLEAVGEAYRRCGLQRGRRVRLAERGSRVLAIALLEECSLGVQLTEVTNGFDVFPLVDGEEGKLAVRALLDDATAVYGARGLQTPVLLTSLTDKDLFLSAGYEWASSARMWTWHRRQLRDWAAAWDDYFLASLEPAPAVAA